MRRTTNKQWASQEHSQSSFQKALTKNIKDHQNTFGQMGNDKKATKVPIPWQMESFSPLLLDQLISQATSISQGTWFLRSKSSERHWQLKAASVSVLTDIAFKQSLLKNLVFDSFFTDLCNQSFSNKLIPNDFPSHPFRLFKRKTGCLRRRLSDAGG